MASGAITRLALARLQREGHATTTLLRRAGLRRSQLDEPTIRIGVSNQIQFLKAASECLEDDLLGFHLALDFELRQVGLLFYVMSSSENLNQAFARACRYSSIVNEGIAINLEGGRHVGLRFRYTGVARHSDRHQVEFWLTSFVRVARLLTKRPLVPTRVCFAHHRSRELSELRRFFGCPLGFDAKMDEVLFAPRDLSRRLVDADPYLNDLLIQYCQEALARRNETNVGLRAQVENVIAPLLPHGAPHAKHIATTLGMSERTLARQLARENLTLRMVLAELRADLASRYLQLPNIPISQVAWLLGYKEPSAFTNAFKMRTGRSPKQARSLYLAKMGDQPRHTNRPAGHGGR
jgi:AraC-like DNA-binding protein